MELRAEFFLRFKPFEHTIAHVIGLKRTQTHPFNAVGSCRCFNSVANIHVLALAVGGKVYSH